MRAWTPARLATSPGRTIHAPLLFHYARMIELLHAAEVLQGLLADPDLVQRFERGQAERTRCTACNQCIAAMDDGIGIAEAGAELLSEIDMADFAIDHRIHKAQRIDIDCHAARCGADA